MRNKRQRTCGTLKILLLIKFYKHYAPKKQEKWKL